MKTKKRHLSVLTKLAILIFSLFLLPSLSLAQDVDFSWTTNPEAATEYKIHYKTGSDNTSPYDGTGLPQGDSPISVGNVTAFTVTGLSPIETYHFAFQAVVGQDESNLTALVSHQPYSDNHDFTGLPLTSDGWTDLQALIQSDSRIVFVSNSGNDDTAEYYTAKDPELGNNPFAPSNTIKPYATLSAAYNKLRDGYPDVLLLERGGSWNERLTLKKSGLSADKRQIIGAYGSLSSDRPIIEAFRTSYGPNNPEDIFSYVILASIEWTDTTGWEIGGDHILIEDCAVFDGENSGLVVQGLGEVALSNFTIRRCVIAGRYPLYDEGTGHTQGLFISTVHGGLIEENVFDHNGWTEADTGNQNDNGNIHSHNTYVNVKNSNIIMRYNISTRAGSHGLQMGAGGLLYGNLSVQDSIAIQMARSESYVPNGFTGEIKSNVVLHPKDIRSNEPRGWGIRILNSAGITIEDNILGHNIDAGYRVGILLEADIRYDVQMKIRNVTIQNNILHNFPGAVILSGYDPNMMNIKLLDNQIHNGLTDDLLVNVRYDNGPELESSGNKFYSVGADVDRWFGYDDAYYDTADWMSKAGDTTSVNAQTIPTGEYTIPAYLSSIGETATLESFYNNIRQQRKGNWDDRYTAIQIINFVRGHFGRPPLP